MPKITQMNKTAIKSISEQAWHRLETLAEELGLTVDYVGGSYNPPGGEATVKFSFKLKEIGGVDRQKAEWDRLCGGYGLKPEQYRASVIVKAQKYELVGFALSKPKFPIQAQRVSDGKVYGLTLDVLRMVDMEAYYHNMPWKRPEMAAR